MSPFIQKSKAMLFIFAISVAFVSCISDTGLDPVQDEVFKLEAEPVIPYDFALENLRIDPETLKMLADLRNATSKYHQFDVADEDGYELGSECVEVPGLGGMGFHYVDFPAIFMGYDPTSPQALLYEMTKNGKLRLVAVEFVIDKATWDAENAEPPHFGSREFDFDDAQALPFPNYQLHVWIWKHNPSGIFSMFNPKVSCE